MSQSIRSHHLPELFSNAWAFNDLNDVVKVAIADAIWGDGLGDDESKKRLMHYFRYYLNETTATTVIRTSRRDSRRIPLQTHGELISFIRLLKQNPLSPRKDLKLDWQSVTPPTTEATLDLDGALDLTVRVMFMAACRSPTAYNVVTTGQIFKPSWKDEETLVEFIEKIFPRYELNQGNGAEPIRIEKLTAHYLKEYANVQIEWTNHFPDHLTLQRTNDGKYLYVFGHAGFLETCFRTLAEHKLDENVPTGQALSS
jgi:hypothetical protein